MFRMGMERVLEMGMGMGMGMKMEIGDGRFWYGSGWYGFKSLGSEEYLDEWMNRRVIKNK